MVIIMELITVAYSSHYPIQYTLWLNVVVRVLNSGYGENNSNYLE